MGESLGRLSNPKFLPKSVYEELIRGEAQGKPEASLIRELVERATIKITTPSSASTVRSLIKIAAQDENKPLHRAEAEALVVAKELGGIVIADDRIARSVARLMHAELHGTGYLLGRMCQEGLISKREAMTKIRDMRRAGWRLSEDDYQTILSYLRTL